MPELCEKCPLDDSGICGMDGEYCLIHGTHLEALMKFEGECKYLLELQEKVDA